MGLVGSLAAMQPTLAAPARQLECAYDQINAKTMQAVIRILQSGDQASEEVVNARIDKLTKPIIDGCAQRYGWTETDQENAKRHYFASAVERLLGAILDYEKVDTAALHAMYKAEPLTRAEMADRFETDTEVYEAEWVQKILAAKIGARTEETAKMALGYIQMRMAEEDIADDFENGVVRE
jgi:hypothetical protein